MKEFVIRKPITFALLVAVTATIILVTVLLSGKSYESLHPFPFDDLKLLSRRLGARPISTQILSVIVVPIIANVLLFVPWGFLVFILFYSVDRPTLQTYVLTILIGFSFTLAIEAWQYFTPSRVADVNDVIWNTAGTIAGALLGHARLRLRVEFE
ncbi:MAG TPA: VanZ family protein [Thermoanaerobaculia bacterium]|nr:VanZ family protein [Thermoanaerobaculia bacterium]